MERFVFLEHTQQFRSWLPFVVNMGWFGYLILSWDKTSQCSYRSLQCPESSLARDANCFCRKSKLNSHTNLVGVKIASPSSCQTQIIARESRAHKNVIPNSSKLSPPTAPCLTVTATASIKESSTPRKFLSFDLATRLSQIPMHRSVLPCLLWRKLGKCYRLTSRTLLQ